MIVDKSADLKLTARRVLWAKTINAGQVSSSPRASWSYLLTWGDLTMPCVHIGHPTSPPSACVRTRKLSDSDTVPHALLVSSTHIVGIQTCSAPDYILVTDGRQDDLVAAFKEVYAQFYPEGPASSESFSRIIAEHHFDRIRKMLNDTKGRVVLGGETKREEKYIAPTIVTDVTNEDSLMSACVYIVCYVFGCHCCFFLCV